MFGFRRSPQSFSLPLDATDQMVLQALYSWLDLLIRGEYQKAVEFAYQPAGHSWTADLLHERIRFFADQWQQPLQLPSGQSSRKPEHCVVRPSPTAPPPVMLHTGRRIGSYQSLLTAQQQENPAYLGEAVLQLPFGGQWSEVFATFAMLNHRNRLVLALKSIYVH